MADIVSERYAQSLYEVAKDEKQEKEYLEELTAVCGRVPRKPRFPQAAHHPLHRV